MSTPKIKKGDKVLFAGTYYVVAEVSDFPHGTMIGIYDEPPSKHIDYLNPSSIKKVKRQKP
jgi:hypothetical protein